MDSLTLNLIASPFKGSTFLTISNSNSKRFNKASISVKNSLNPQNPNSIWGHCGFPARPLSYLIPLLKKVTALATKPSPQKWGSDFEEAKLLQNGTFGTALMSVTATAKVKISPFVATLAANPTFVSALCAWAVAQSTKVFLNFCVERKWDFRIMFSCGGMPSSHSALCTALTASVAICHGVADSLFPVCLGFTLIVMYDAIGVRRHAGMQAQVLNVIVEDLFQGHPISQRKLKELLGHTPSQVFAGALLGILVAWRCSQVCAFPAS
ncbi:hypothetical protein SASPL_102578 [Salvia splendens]|uniref:Acid phosphatase/vanadium-dependent haloperoxidase-related protein n=1 Tax=Salvia splendens TaxID=180675 RepID=A0A8X8YWH2_SALSN|nr:uncharacterized membrane protein YuiD-like [Salvia splendens]KAG6437656.1 hypothetical protein SASPL_102578 [Salvia splendens]